MKDHDMTKQELLAKLARLERRVTDLEASEAEYRRTIRDLQANAQIMQVSLDSNPSELAGANERLRKEIVERAQAEDALRTSEQRLDMALNGADLGPWDWNVRTGRAVIRERTAEIIGYALEEIEPTFDFWISLLHPEDRPRALEKALAHLAGSAGDHYEDEYRLRTKSGEWRWILSRGKIVEWDQDGRPTRVTGTYLDIDARKRAEQALAENEARYRALFEHMKNGVAIYRAESNGEDFTFLDFNKAAEDISGTPRDSVIGKRVCDVFPGIKDLGLLDLLQKTWRTGNPSHLPVGRYKDERIEIWVENFIYRLPSGEIVAVFSDETQRKRAEEALKESEHRFRLLYQEAPMSYQSLDENGRVLEVNRAWLDLLGYSREEVVGKWFGDFLPPRWRDHFITGFPKFIATGEVRGLQVEMLKKDGSEISVAFDGKVARTEDRTFKQTHCVLQDITDKKLAEEALRKSEAKYRAIFNNAAIGIDLVDTQGRFREVNPALAKMLGYSQEELENLDILKVTHPNDSRNSAERLDCLVQGDCDSYRLEKRYVRKDGSDFWADLSVSAIRGPSGEHEATIGVITDISERKRFEVAQRRLATAIEQAGEAIVITDARGVIEYVNPAFEHVTGYTRDEIRGSNTQIFRSGEHDDAFYESLWNTVRNGHVWKGRFINRKKDGSIYHEDATISPVRDTSGKIVNFVAVKRDMTETLELSKQLLQAQKMEAIGTLAGGIAHDFNNILQITLGFSEMLLADKDETDQEYADLKKIVQAASNGADLVQRLLTFSRKVEPKPRPVRLNQQIRQLEKLLGRTIPKMIGIKLSLDEDLCTVNADPTQMEQIVMNLAVNASDAMPEGGELLVRTRNVDLDEEFCRAHCELRPGKYAMLEISDTGQGMDNETLQHIFEPFYTTKELGRGTGLGLAMVYGIVNQHGGLIECESEPSRGTRFRIYLPAMPTAEKQECETAGIAPPFGTETILLVDDEEFVRDLGRRILMRSGYTVLTAANGREALDLFSRSEGKIELVILDLIMPEMGGKQCLQELLRIDPQLTVLIASGYSTDGPLEDAVGAGARGFVSKPFRINDLLKAVRKALDSE